MANAFACGVLLFQYEHGAALPGFEALAPARAKQQKGAAKTVVKHVAALPKELIGGVMAAPHDDAPRLVLADWLTEQADPRGEFIQVQCALGRALFGAEGKWVLGGRKALPFETREQLEAREQELLKAHEKQWIAPIRKVVRQWGFRRGFVNHVITDLATFAAATDSALAETPLESAKLTGFKATHLRALCKAAPHATLETLNLGMNRLNDGAAALFASPFLSKVTGLNLEGNPLGDACLRALASPRSILRLGLYNGEFDDTAFSSLAKAPWWGSLTGLSLARCQALTPRALETVNAAAELDWLVLDLPGLTDADVVGVAKAHPKLKQLSFSRAQVSERAVEAVIAALPTLGFLEVPRSLPEAAQERLRARFAGTRWTQLM
ncbi:MAG: TIGR02996 domain-containing protein [Myxococcaceae bacterium]|nr:TIGR02996 domain-containing protein [Myxococcaceae bacterium]